MARQKSMETREKLLQAASDVFMEKGFRDATVAEICRRAEANVSAVNYYFGSKEALYQETWRHAFAESVKAHPLNGGVPVGASASERLHGQVKGLMARLADENNREFFIAQMELANPTGLLKEVMQSVLNPLREKALALMREMLGPQATEQQVMFCEICLLSMCLHPMLMRKVGERTHLVEGALVPDDLDAFTEHVLKFALAGIAAVRDDIPADQQGMSTAGNQSEKNKDSDPWT